MERIPHKIRSIEGGVKQNWYKKEGGLLAHGQKSGSMVICEL